MYIYICLCIYFIVLSMNEPRSNDISVSTTISGTHILTETCQNDTEATLMDISHWPNPRQLEQHNT